jgi:hypothetical protein
MIGTLAAYKTIETPPQTKAINMNANKLMINIFLGFRYWEFGIAYFKHFLYSSTDFRSNTIARDQRYCPRLSLSVETYDQTFEKLSLYFLVHLWNS